MTLTADRLRVVLSYDPETGVFRWREAYQSRLIGKEAGHVRVTGYRMIKVDDRQYYAHRLAFLHMTGLWPTKHIDHRNRQRDDQRWDNLREASIAENARNRLPHRSILGQGLKGTLYQRGKWEARITVAGRKIRLGSFETAEQAHAAYIAAATEHFSEFVRGAA